MSMKLSLSEGKNIIKSGSLMRTAIMILLFSQPISTLIFAASGLSFSFNILYIIVSAFLILSLGQKMLLSIWQFTCLIIVMISLLSTALFSHSIDNSFSIGVLVQCILVITAINIERVDSRRLKKYYVYFLIMMIPNIIVGVAQIISQKPIFVDAVLGAQNSDVRNVNNIWQFGENIRSFGLFYSNGYFGIYLVGLLMFFIALSTDKKLYLFIGFPIILSLIYFTYTRTAYIQVITAVFIGILIYRFARYIKSPRIMFSIVGLVNLLVFSTILFSVSGVRRQAIWLIIKV